MLDDPEDETDGDDSGDKEGKLVLFGVSLGSMQHMRLLIFWEDFLVFLFLGLKWNEGGGVSGGRVLVVMVFLGVPGWDSHRNGTAPQAPP